MNSRIGKYLPNQTRTQIRGMTDIRCLTPIQSLTHGLYTLSHLQQQTSQKVTDYDVCMPPIADIMCFSNEFLDLVAKEGGQRDGKHSMSDTKR